LALKIVGIFVAYLNFLIVINIIFSPAGGLFPSSEISSLRYKKIIFLEGDYAMKKLIFLTLSALTLLPVNVLAQGITDTAPGPDVLPEPTSLILIVTGLVGVLGARRIFKK